MAKNNMLEYLHYQRNNFLETRPDLKATVNVNNVHSRIKKEYNRIAKAAKSREEDFKSLSPVANDMLSLFATTQNLSQLMGNDTQVDAGVDAQMQSGSFDQHLRDAASAAAGFNDRLKHTSNKVDELNNLLSQISSLLDNLDVINAELLEYCANLPEHQKESVNASFRADGKLQILNINPTAASSLRGLKSRLDSINQAQGAAGGGFPQSVTYINSKGETKTTSVAGAVYSMRQLIINILGGYGEALSAIYAMSKADEIIEKMAQQDPKLTVSGSGTTKLQGQTAKSDVKVTYKDNQVNLSVGVSAKAQLHKSKKSTITTFQTSKLKVFMGVKSFTKKMEYNFFNNIYHGVTNNEEQVALNRYLAALNFDNAVTGINIGDNVMFLSYLDRVLTVSEFYNSIAKHKGKISDFPRIALSGFTQSKSDWEGENEGVASVDDTPLEKNSLAWERSRAMRNIILDLQAQIQYTH